MNRKEVVIVRDKLLVNVATVIEQSDGSVYIIPYREGFHPNNKKEHNLIYKNSYALRKMELEKITETRFSIHPTTSSAHNNMIKIRERSADPEQSNERVFLSSSVKLNREYIPIYFQGYSGNSQTAINKIRDDREYHYLRPYDSHKNQLRVMVAISSSDRYFKGSSYFRQRVRIKNIRCAVFTISFISCFSNFESTGDGGLITFATNKDKGPSSEIWSESHLENAFKEWSYFMNRKMIEHVIAQRILKDYPDTENFDLKYPFN